MEQQTVKQRSSSDIYLDFAKELSDCQNGGSLPESATQDSRFYLELQRKKLSSMGVTIKDRLIDDGLLRDVHGIHKEDRKYISQILYRDYKKRTEYYLNGSKKYKYSDSIVLYQNVLNIKQGGVLPDDPVSCPHCGAPSTFGKLQNGCEYCETRFLMTELYPKCAAHYFLHNYSMTPKDMKIRMALCMIAAAIIYAFCYFGIYGNPLDLVGVLVCIFGGAIFGFIGFDVLVMLGLFIGLFTTMPMAARMGGRKTLIRFMMQYDPNFSFEHFTYKAIALLKTMLFRGENDDLAIYAGSEPPPTFDIVDAFYRGGMGIYNCKVSPDGYAHITADIFMEDIHCSGGRIYCKKDVFRVGLCKSIRKPDELGFSYKAVKCPVCGFSFDASKVNCCPACHNNYRLEDDDWVITSIKKV